MKLKKISDPQWNSKTRKFAYVQTHMNEEENKYISNIYVGKVDSNISPITYGKHRNHSPRWSPCGKKLAFVSDRNDRLQIYVINVNDGEAEQITTCLNGATNPVWSPCGMKLLFSTPVTSNEKLSDNHLAIVDLQTKEMIHLTEEGSGYGSATFSPDGNYVAYATNKEDDSKQPEVTDIFMMNLHTKEKKKITNSNGYFSTISWSPDGKKIGFLGKQKEYSASFKRVWIYNLQLEQLINLSEGLDLEAAMVKEEDLQSGIVNPGLMWTDDSEGFYFLVSDQGNSGVYYGSLDGAMYPIVLEQEKILGMTMITSSHEAIIVSSTTVNLEKLYHLDFINQTRVHIRRGK